MTAAAQFRLELRRRSCVYENILMPQLNTRL